MEKCERSVELILCKSGICLPLNRPVSGEPRQLVNVYLNDEDVRLGSGLGSKVHANHEISIVPAVVGG
jgi:molybdopterin converting factor small subunit